MAEDRPLRIAYCTWEDPRDKRSFSGVHYHVLRAFEKHCGEVICLGPMSSPAMDIGRTVDRWAGKLFGRHYDFLHSKRVARDFARQVERKLASIDCDLIFAPVVSEMIAYLETDLPIVYMADATFSLLEDTYPRFTRLLSGSRRQSHEIEQRAIDNAAIVVYASEWAAASGRSHYGCPPDKIRIERFGTNLDDPPPASLAAERRLGEVCRLLFIGREWERKGGSLTIGALRALVDRGVDARLTIIGCEPPASALAGIDPQRLDVIPYLDKNDAHDSDRYHRALVDATFLVAPTRRDCSPMIYGEAGAYGVPSVTSAVGGVSSLVRDGENGVALALDAGPEAYAEWILDVFEDPALYRRMAARSREIYETELNWDRFGRNLRSVLDDAVASTRPSSPIDNAAAREAFEDDDRSIAGA